MYHRIQFTTGVLLDLEISRQRRVERVRLSAGTRRYAQLKPYAVESTFGPVEVADLFFDDGTTSRAVPFGCFAFVE